ncbi:DMT family transporter [Paucibacter sp. XJ19-41]|uniref:DMT family transporter n=1 Tax=Paucibacter sp. XJ19-41 TaxID=2927824 RepID=UPI00234BEBAE|nr:DMT family transporter [Paucibacter sp. XJ19-41]MDC6168516.1 DMT family transporter [Paucibacter sp. XJ19-41]
MSDALKGQLLCSLAMLLVGSTVAVSKIIGADIEPFLATALRHAMALPVFVWLAWRSGCVMPRLSRHDALLLLVQAAAGSVGYTVLLIQGVMWSSAADAGVVAGTLPAMAALLAVLMLGERPGLRLLGAIALATLGVMALALAPDSAAATPTRLLGIAAVLAAIACEAVFILGTKRLRQPLPPLLLSTLMCAGGLLLSVLPACYLARSTPSTLSPAALMGIAYYAWLPTVGGFVLWYAGSARTSGVRASLATAWLPVSALLLSALLLGEAVQPWQWAGLACVLAAVVLASTGGARTESSAAPSAARAPART